MDKNLRAHADAIVAASIKAVLPDCGYFRTYGMAVYEKVR